MTIETYYNFIKIVECGSILNASAELMIAQPALSTQLKNLESSLGVTLLERTNKKLNLTPAGQIFYKKVKSICALDTSIKSELYNYKKGITGVLTLSMTPSNPSSLMHRLFDQFVENHPEVTFEIHEGLSFQIEENVRTGISEIGLIRSPISKADDFHILPFCTDEIVVILPKSNPLSQYHRLSLEQLKNQQIITTDALAPAIVQAFHSINAEPNFYLKTSLRRTALFWTTAYQNCITMLPCTQEEIASEQPDLRMLRIFDYNFLIQRSIIVMRNRKLSPISRAFLQSIDVSCDFADI